MRLLGVSIALFGAANAAVLHPRSPKSNATFDYVVIGGGTGGLTIAKRLSERNVTVAVIEAGGAANAIPQVIAPGADNYWVGADPADTNPQVDWGIVTTPQKGAAEREIHYARGRVLGGSSARNYLVYQRSTIGSYQKWADAVGDQSYAWHNFLPHFLKSPNFTPPNTTLRAANASAEYNAGAFLPAASAGPLDVSYANFAQPFSSWVQGSLNELGIANTTDFNSGSLLGCQYCSSTIQPADEFRETSQTAFVPDLTPGTYPNLVIFSNTLAKKILFNHQKAAVGVVIADGTNSNDSVVATIKARKEVILSAGAFQSPQILMVSGVGPKSTLEKFGINIVANLPGVGKNMWDHIFIGPSYRVNVETNTRVATDPEYQQTAIVNFSTTHTGPLTNSGCDFLGWEKAPADVSSCFSHSTLKDLETLPEDWPDFEYISGPGYVGNFSNLVASQPKDGYQYATILGTLVAPFSRGTVTIKSADTRDLPIVDPNWLTTKTDQELAIAVFKRARAAFQTKFMSGVLVDTNEYYPGASIETDAQILEYIQQNVMTVWHASCTCKMGKKSDRMAVVDSHARVYGVRGLRVVDASSFPLLPPGHPQSTVYALAEKIAVDILKN